MTGPLAGIHGPLLSSSFLAGRHTGSDHYQTAAVDPQMTREARSIIRQVRECSVASPRAVADRLAGPLVRFLGFSVRGLSVLPTGTCVSTLAAGDRALALLAVRGAGDALDGFRLEIVREAAARGLRWALACNARALRLMDCSRPHARRWIDAALEEISLQPEAVQIVCEVFGAHALSPRANGRSPLEEMIAASDAELDRVRQRLQRGVEQAAVTLTGSMAAARPGKPAPPLHALFEEALTVVYRILFLMFAESRGLVPTWHPVYREAYTIAALRDAIADSGGTRGTWDALQAIARLAHRGASAGSLRVAPFNGRLFSPRHAPIVARLALPEERATAILASLTLDEDGPVRRRLPFMDLGVEQLGAVYERVLDFAPAVSPGDGGVALRRSPTRKDTGSFYTPRPVTEFLVRRALHPLVADATPEQILTLRVLDPAMGSGAFLVAACRYLAAAYEMALIRSGAAGATDLSPADRAGFRRLIAQRCLFGVDINPMAVQLGRLSVWLCALAADKPLSFLDHRLRTGNSVAGASLDDVARQAPGRSRRTRGTTLFDESAFDAIAAVAKIRESLALRPDDTTADVHAKERLLGELDAAGGPLARFRRLLDLWCSVWFWPEGDRAPDVREHAALAALLKGDASFVHASARARLERAEATAGATRFFHWTLEFPEVFFGNRTGFDAVVGNPPWDMLRGHGHGKRLVRFTRESGIYHAQSDGHANLYQLFVERALHLLRPGGRLGLVLPWGFASDAGSAGVRRLLLERTEVDEIVGMENSKGIFPIHRGLKFLVLHSTNGGRTAALRCRLGVTDVHALDRLPDRPDPADESALTLSRELLTRASGGALAIPYLTSREDVLLLDALARAGPPLSTGWRARFGRELNATDDRHLFEPRGGGWPVIAGRHLSAFAVATPPDAPRADPARLPARVRTAANRARLAYRDVAGAGNRTTLIAAIVPARVVTTHTLFCMRSQLSEDEQLWLCALFNSYVLNYVVRQRVSTHVTTAIVESLPVPRPSPASESFRRIVSTARALSAGAGDARARALLEAEIARLYGLDEPEFAHVLSSFPLLPSSERNAAFEALEGRR